MPASTRLAFFLIYHIIVRYFRFILSIFLSISLLWAGAGFSVSRHYCLGMLKSESFYTQADFCSSHADTNTKQESCDSDCCDEEWLSVAAIEIERSVQDELQIDIPKVDFQISTLITFSPRQYDIPYPPPNFENHRLTLPDLAQIQRFLI